MAGHKPHHIAQGEYATARGPDASISTILGSCVATCLYDEQAQVGGMNHFLLPDGAGASLNSARFGVNAMELLINALIKEGANRSRLKAKVFGGGRMIAGLSDVGAKNASFVLDFLRREAIECTGQSLGGTQARRVEFWPGSGRARQRLLGETQVVEAPPPKMPAAPVGGGLELF
ncbi:chemotaxis protein CheD [Rhodobacter aestuarii]|uniref:Probable chemoreceptor glutamine deamidase CheD n=1 Tax=Rhodobacter aestuarii TaxID=453582 RepID=A0A1N7J9H9_9RHOB|nr:MULTISPECIES: chemotaxis protein CheD [Rhodobacter]PTV97030.1 chemotaxis protein CheD [Rhodobacter aestuarii]SIS45988.1 chemotaxis protein CheD [Rhodobacter aestuarii]SOB98326.1 chemotaxis protein CheD [Rhodobacter sp. JA431]